MKYHALLLSFLTLLITYYPSLGQEKFSVLSGKITDATSHQPISAANIQLKSGNTGTISNTLGEFTFKIPESRSADSILISCIGYEPLLRSFAAINLQGVNIELKPAVITLPEVSVHARSGLEILQKAIAAIPINYDTAAARMTAFYREDIRYDHDTLAYNESVLDVFKTFYGSKERKDQVRIIKGRKMQPPPNNDPQFYNWISNITNTAYSALREDIVKNHDLKNSLLAPRNFRYYNYTLRETIHVGDQQLFVLEVSPKKNSRKGIVQGRIYIDEASLAIVRLEFETTPAGADYINKHGRGGIAYTLMSKVIGASLDFNKIKMVVSYKYYQGKYYLHTVRRHWDVGINSRKRSLKDVPWTGDFDFLVTEVNKDSVQQFASGISSNRQSMNNLVGNSYDAAFWENYNILQPVLPDSLKTIPVTDTVPTVMKHVSNRQNGFTRADTLRGQLSPLRSCYDVTFYHLDVAVDLDSHYLKGNNTIRYKVVSPFDRMQVDLYANMKIDSIIYKGGPLHYTREYDAVFVQFAGIQSAGTEQEVTIYYEGIPQVPDKNIPMNGGILWEKDEEGNPWAQVVCQGSGASLWWPNKDHLSDEPDSMRIWITVPNGFTEVSNGRLQRKTPVGDNQTRYEWQVSYPINNYNATFSIGKYAHQTGLYVGQDSVTIDYYVMPYNLARAQKIFAKTPQMLACFEKYFGPYAFRRDGFTLVETPYPMEHQSGVCIGRISKDHNLDYPTLVWHESAHEWWGNAISCTDVADMWIHEAFATYAEALVLECSYGEKLALEYLNNEKGGVSNQEPVIGVYDVNHIYYNIGDMYNKGCLMLNTFRYVLHNDTLWFNLLKDIQQHFRYKTLSSEELVSYICQRTRHDYTAFFDQYLKYTRLPALEFATKEQGSNLVVKYRWKADVKNFNMPVKITTAAGRFGFVYPTATWKTITLKNMKTRDFEVDEEHFFIDVVETEQL